MFAKENLKKKNTRLYFENTNTFNYICFSKSEFRFNDYIKKCLFYTKRIWDLKFKTLSQVW